MTRGFGGLPGNMKGMVEQAQKLQKQLQKVQEDAQAYSAEGSAGGGMVKCVANGQNKLVSVSIDKQVVNPEDIEMLQDLVLAAANEALQKVQENLKNEMGKVTGGLNLPGIL